MGFLLSCYTRSPSAIPSARPHRARSRSPSKHNVPIDTSTISQPYVLGFQPPCASTAGRPEESRSRSRTPSLPRWFGGSVQFGRSVSTIPDGEADHMHMGQDPEAQRLQHDCRAAPEGTGTGGSGAARHSRSGNGNGSERRRGTVRKAVSASTLRASYTAAGASADETGVRSHGCTEGDVRDGASSPASILQHRPLPDTTHRPTMSDPTTCDPPKSAATSGMPAIPAHVVRFETPGLYDRFPNYNARSSPRSSPLPPSSPTLSMSPILQITSRRKTTSLPSQPHSRHISSHPRPQPEAKRQVRVGDIPFPLRVDPPRSLRSPTPSPSSPGHAIANARASGMTAVEGPPYAFTAAGSTMSEYRGQDDSSIDSRLARSPGGTGIIGAANGSARTRSRDRTRSGADEHGQKLRKVHRVEGDWELWGPEDWGGAVPRGRVGGTV